MPRSPATAPAGLFAGLCTLDIIQLVTRMPGPNEKVTAQRQVVAAGGPAANAAVAFAHLGGAAVLVTGVGSHPLAAGIRADLDQAGVRLADAAAGDPAAPPASSIFVTEGTGERAVVSRNAAGRVLAPPAGLGALAAGAAVVLVDAHHQELARAAARAAREAGTLCVLDGGSYREGTEDLLACADVAVCSADFRPPGTSGPAQVLDYLAARGVAWAAVTDGARPIRWSGGGQRGEVPVPAVPVADTLGAGDFFHGALAWQLCSRPGPGPGSWQEALAAAAEVAAASCRSFGTRAWLAGGPAAAAGDA